MAKHYVQPGTLDRARTEPLMQLLDLKKTERELDTASHQAEQLLASLPAETLARLLELASRTTESPLSPIHSFQSPQGETVPPPT